MTSQRKIISSKTIFNNFHQQKLTAPDGSNMVAPDGLSKTIFFSQHPALYFTPNMNLPSSPSSTCSAQLFPLDLKTQTECNYFIKSF
jgi:hypothetical protein